ncbi:MAG: AEC family transporter [Erysipelotrichaceae bacterium]
MNELVLAFNVVFPLCLMMSLGYLLRMLHVLKEPLISQLTRLCFQVFLPFLLFINVYQSDFEEIFKPKLIGYAIAIVFITFIVVSVIASKCVKQTNRKGVVIQGIFRSNYILFGLPIAAALFGKENTGTTAVLIAFVVPLFNVLSIIILDIYKEGKINYKRTLKDILKNPLIIASFLAFVFIILHIQLPTAIITTIEDIAGIATPLALLALGAGFAFKAAGTNLNLLMIVAACKLVIVPLIWIPISLMLGFKGMELGAIMTLLAAPTAVSSFTMAESMKGDSELAGQIVVITSTLSIVTLFMWITILKMFHLF